jgi:hypothetical protein
MEQECALGVVHVLLYSIKQIGAARSGSRIVSVEDVSRFAYCSICLTYICTSS